MVTVTGRVVLQIHLVLEQIILKCIFLLFALLLHTTLSLLIHYFALLCSTLLYLFNTMYNFVELYIVLNMRLHDIHV